jgi:hypothetical protein
MKRTLKKDGKTYVVTFDAEHVADTIERDGKIISSADRVAQQILRHADTIARGLIAPKGFEWVRK